MTITLKNVDSTTLEAIKNLQKIQKNLEIEIQGEKDFEALRKKMLKKLRVLWISVCWHLILQLHLTV